MDPAVCWKCTGGKLKRAGNQKSYQKSGFFKALYRSFCHAASGIICREVDLSVTNHVDYLECCAYEYSKATNIIKKTEG